MAGSKIATAGPGPQQMVWSRVASAGIDHCLAIRDRLLASPRFQRWACAFPPTRLIARRRARDLFDLCAGFVYSQVLLACVQLNVFEALLDGPKRVDVLASQFGLTTVATRRLLLAAASLRLVAPRGKERFGLGPLGAAIVKNPGIIAMVQHHAMLYADMGDPVALLRGERSTNLSSYWPYAGADAPERLVADQVSPYSALMAASQAFIAEEVLSAYRLAGHRCLLDIGGGEGAFIEAAAAREPNLRFILFDLPAVADRANARFAAGGLSGRASAIGGDFFTGPLPRGADIISLIRVIHDHDDEGALQLLNAVRQALPVEGTVLIAEPMSGTAGARPIGDAYFGFYLLAMGRGRPRTPVELQDMLKYAGFDRVRMHANRRPILSRIISARRTV